MHFTHAAFSGWARACRPACGCSLLREFTTTSRPFPGSLRSARLWREKEPKTSWWSSAAQPGRDRRQKVFVSTSQSDDWGLLLLNQPVCAFLSLFFFKKSANIERIPSSAASSTPLVVGNITNEHLITLWWCSGLWKDKPLGQAKGHWS